MLPPSQTTHTQDRLQKWTTCALDTLLASDRHSAGDIKDKVITFALECLRTAFRNRDVNGQNALVRLPPALLARILGDPLPISGVTAVSRSCRRLRSTTLACPEIWNRDTLLRSPTDLAHKKLMITRSHPTSLDLSISGRVSHETWDWVEQFWIIAKDNMDRLCRLTLIMQDDYAGIWGHRALRRVYPDSHALQERTDRVARESWSMICDALERPAPLLRELALERETDGPAWQHILPTNLFSNDAPLLHSCRLKGAIMPPQGITAFANLASLHYSAGPQRLELDLQSFGRILDGLSHLETLVLRGYSFFNPGGGCDTQCAPSRLRNVRILSVPSLVEISPGVTRRSLRLPQVHDFFHARGVRHFEYAFVGYYTPNAFDPPEQLLQAYPNIEAMALLLPHVELRTSSTTVVVFKSFWHPEDFFVTEPALYALLEHLTIHEWFWPTDGVLPDAPRLHTLTVVLSTFSEFQIFFKAFGRTCSLFDADDAWECPALHTLVLAYAPPGARRRSPSMRPVSVETEEEDLDPALRCGRPDGDTLPISLRETHRFVATCLRFLRPRLALLQLVGVDPVDADAWGLLRAVADEVQFSSSVDDTLAARIAWHWRAEDDVW